MEFINELWEANKMTESALLDLKIDESAVNAFDAKGYAKSYSAYTLEKAKVDFEYLAKFIQKTNHIYRNSKEKISKFG